MVGGVSTSIQSLLLCLCICSPKNQSQFSSATALQLLDLSLPPVSWCLISGLFYSLILEEGGAGEKERVRVFFHLFVYSLVSCMCLD